MIIQAQLGEPTRTQKLVSMASTRLKIPCLAVQMRYESERTVSRTVSVN